MGIQRYLLSLLCSVFLVHVATAKSGFTRYFFSTPMCFSSHQKIREVIKKGMKDDPDLIPAFSRAAFHDCITATSSKPNSGCNGSLRLEEEITNMNNDRLQPPLDFLRQHLPTIAHKKCASFADGIQLGAEVAMQISGGPKVLGKLVNSAAPRVDVDDPDTVEGELPDEDDPFPKLLDFYARKGFNLREMVVSNVGGHALGAFEDDEDNQEKPFTTTETSFNIDYAVNLVQRIDTGKNLEGFHTLNSDLELLNNTESVFWLKYYAGHTGVGYVPSLGKLRLLTDYGKFLIKLASLKGSNLPAKC
ncbi:L-ascorbate peroxidase 5, peroxisomal [Gracilariopsis chorda]|uniref:L-ascorbate peroxidase 5, peroxisomal n=1 Tax=Gracilariopsis chorda TaxID=448386 RepID=A0A2V3IG38_9FLOR|nr:L-ascorbate peroxidase 5, peroxisomal [Gracilariopsis chorda]|eukprot:PXF41012.1 L-ascorbate peroxidase 5, peroxisomal [Gracilariopsis chorda]